MQFLCFPYGTNIQCWCDNTGTIKRCVPVLLNLGIIQYQEENEQSASLREDLSFFMKGEKTELFLALLFLVLVFLIFIIFASHKCSRMFASRTSEVDRRKYFKATHCQTDSCDPLTDGCYTLQETASEQLDTFSAHSQAVLKLQGVHSVQGVHGVHDTYNLYPSLLRNGHSAMETIRIPLEESELMNTCSSLCTETKEGEQGFRSLDLEDEDWINNEDKGIYSINSQQHMKST
ncbi:uncharacterized protein LOC111715070 [Eurytemora carolleeae]|uniref:uncharacterized protein LOC111715070 n=1 Tax=Eurytemora carolleeae TaxID=1294199 RepID=UPI000C789F25|nr:uncharacterized protein LOC111715070 [Eurytemora carolleeae]|eukprot:XP_023346087.1 uncharacterized protein LOC111715070 [Eurytemora affinis]